MDFFPVAMVANLLISGTLDAGDVGANPGEVTQSGISAHNTTKSGERLHKFYSAGNERNGSLNPSGKKKEGKHLRRSTEYEMNEMRSPCYFCCCVTPAAAPSIYTETRKQAPGKSRHDNMAHNTFLGERQRRST